MWHHLTKERCCYCGQHYLSAVAAHQCLETSNPEIGAVGQKQRCLFRDRNLIFPTAWTDLNTTLWLLFGNASSHNTSRPPCCNPTPSQQSCYQRVEIPSSAKINIFLFQYLPDLRVTRTTVSAGALEFHRSLVYLDRFYYECRLPPALAHLGHQGQLHVNEKHRLRHILLYTQDCGNCEHLPNLPAARLNVQSIQAGR